MKPSCSDFADTTNIVPYLDSKRVTLQIASILENIANAIPYP